MFFGSVGVLGRCSGKSVRGCKSARLLPMWPSQVICGLSLLLVLASLQGFFLCTLYPVRSYVS